MRLAAAAVILWSASVWAEAASRPSPQPPKVAKADVPEPPRQAANPPQAPPAGDGAKANEKANDKRPARPASNVAAARKVFDAARAQCAKRGPLVRTLVSDIFNPTRFARRVIDNWNERSEEERTSFIALADKVVGAERRAHAIEELCAEGKLADVVAQDDGTVFFKLRTKNREECASLVLERSGAEWRYRGISFCGATLPFERQWRERHGNGDFATALGALRGEVASN